MTTEVEEIRIPVKSAVEAAKRTAYYEQRGYSHPKEIPVTPPKAVLSAVSICEPSEARVVEIAKVSGCEMDLDRARVRLIREAESHLARLVSLCPAIGDGVTADLATADSLRRAATERIFETQSKLDHLQNIWREFGEIRFQIGEKQTQLENAKARLDSRDSLTEGELLALNRDVTNLLPADIADMEAKTDELRPQITALAEEIGADPKVVLAEMLRVADGRENGHGPIMDRRGKTIIEQGFCNL